MLWEVDIHPSPGQPDLPACGVVADAIDLRLAAEPRVRSARGFLLQGSLDDQQVTRLTRALLADFVVETPLSAPVGDPLLAAAPADGEAAADWHLLHVLPKPGVTDPVAESVLATAADLAIPVEAVRTLKKYWIAGVPEERLPALAAKVLANDAIEEVVAGPLAFDRLEFGTPYRFQRVSVPIGSMDDEALMQLSRQGQLFLSLAEMAAIREHFRAAGRDPTDVELETLAQTWSEHCSHKTLAGRIRYRDEHGTREFANMLRETIFAATETIRRRAGEDDWCVSVFADNAGVVRFDDRYNVCFKVETHNHPSALEPYGGANTGIGGVIRDPMGTGMGAKPICNTDVFCFAPPDTPADALPAGALHPRRVMRGVVAGVRDYGNRMGIPTVNGAVYFDSRYLGNPLVYCGNVGLLPRNMSFKRPQPGDLIVAVGGRTGRDGIHGATFSSAELTHESDAISGGAVQIGNAITEKMLLDVLLTARDRGLYNAVTDCGAGGFSSAVGEMGEKIGAEVDLEQVPLKYEGLSYTEIWISEAQERMVLAVPPEKWEALAALCGAEGVEVTVIGRFVPTGRLVLRYEGHQVADLAMDFLHGGRPPVVREAAYTPPPAVEMPLPEPAATGYTTDLHAILGALNVASKEWIVRQYDHEVQGGSVVKPLVGVENDGPGDAAVLRPRLESYRGIAVACGMNPRYGDLDTYWMAASAIDEAVRNCIALGADPKRIAILDNFCWGNTERPETLGSLVRAALACHDLAVALGTPFISGKDSLNNEFRPQGAEEPIAIPPSLLISAMGIVEDVRRCVTMDLKAAGNALYLVGLTRCEMGGSHFGLVRGLAGGRVPKVDAEGARQTFAALHTAIRQGTVRVFGQPLGVAADAPLPAAAPQGMVRACHDLSEGGLAVAAAEMAFAGGLGARIELNRIPHTDAAAHPAALLFSESNTRFLCEVPPEQAADFEAALEGLPAARIGHVEETSRLTITHHGTAVIDAAIDALKESWQAPLRW